MPLVLLATTASVIASQAVISGAFSVTRQAMYLGYLPRMSIVHTSETEIGQIYIPVLNWTLAIFVMALVVGFQTSSNLASAYGVAVTGTMVIDTVLIALVMVLLWQWPRQLTVPLVGFFLIVDLAFFLGQFHQDPAWRLVPADHRPRHIPAADHLEPGPRAAEGRLGAQRHSGRGILQEGLGRTRAGAGNGDLPGERHRRRAAVAASQPQAQPHPARTRRPAERHHRGGALRLARAARRGHRSGCNCYRVNLHYGYMQATNIPKTLANARYDQLGFFYEPLQISYFLSRKTVIPSSKPGMPLWREKLFAWMVRSSANADGLLLPARQPGGGTGRAGGDLIDYASGIIVAGRCLHKIFA